MQARVIAVAEKVVRAEIFGVETSILARDLSFDWLGDARERFHVGEHILVRILNVQAEDAEHISIKADVKSVEGNTSKGKHEEMQGPGQICRHRGRYPQRHGLCPALHRCQRHRYIPAMTAVQSVRRIMSPLLSRI